MTKQFNENMAKPPSERPYPFRSSDSPTPSGRQCYGLSSLSDWQVLTLIAVAMYLIHAIAMKLGCNCP
jgi:hypothetical protein